MNAETLTIFGNNLPLGIALFDDDQRLLRCNRAWLRYIDESAASTNLPLSTILPDAYPTLAPLMARALAGERVEQSVVPIILRNDVLYWDITLAPQMADGEACAVVLIANDVTERHLANQLLEQRVGDRTRKLSALYDIMDVATQAWNEPLDTVLQACLQKVIQATQASGGAIQLLDAATALLQLRAHAGLDATLVAQLLTTDVNTGLSGWAVRHDNELMLNDVDGDRRTSDMLRQSDVTTYAGVPLTVAGRVIGVVSVVRERRRGFSHDDLALLSSVADQIANVLSHRELRSENDKLLVVQERSRLARELHDAVTQSLYSLMLFAGATKRQLQLGHLDHALQFTQQLEETAQQALKEMRLLLHNLRPAILAEVGLVRALRQRLDAVEARAGVSATLDVDDLDLSAALEEAIYFIASEALNNALKHAQARTVRVTLRQNDDALTLTIEDNGCGFDPTTLHDSGGLGLSTMRERAERLGGMLQIESGTGGTKIILYLTHELGFGVSPIKA